MITHHGEDSRFRLRPFQTSENLTATNRLENVILTIWHRHFLANGATLSAVGRLNQCS